ncbi:MAG: DUF262 domain-containing protein [Candidatus Bathyarchaeia archaeon]|jgi:hypothetical protein
MKRKIEEWPAKELYAKRNSIQYPDFQREPTVWNEVKRQLLIDSMLIGLDIPKIYLYQPEEGQVNVLRPGRRQIDNYDCIDGQQRIVSVIDFFSQSLKLKDGRYWRNLTFEEQQTLLNYKFTIALVTIATEEDLRLLFLRLQLGSILNVGEKLHAMKGGMHDFVFDVGKNHPFFVKVTIPERRFARETVFAQICINSFYRSLHGTFYSARYEELKAFFAQYSNLEEYGSEVTRIRHTLDLLDQYFGVEATQFRNRATIVSGYLFFEQLIVKDETEKLPIFVKFYLEFLRKLSQQSSRGLDYDPQYRGLLDFQTNILQAAVSRAAIEARNRILEEYFDYYLETKKIKTTPL